MTEAALLRSAASGDARALEQVIRNLAPTVHAYLCGMLGDERDAEDAMQETFVRAARAIERYNVTSDAEAWIFSLAGRVAGDIRPTPSAPPGETPPVEGDQRDWARRSLRALPADLREVVVCKNILRWNAERIARTLNIDSDEVSRRLLAGYTKLTEGMRSFRG